MRWPSRSERAQRAALLLDPDVDRWRRRLQKSSPSSADVWPRRLGAFSVRVRKTPSELLTLSRKDLVDLLDLFEEEERARGRKGSYVAYTVKVVRSWLRFGGVDLPRGSVKVRDADRVFEETALSRDQLRSVLHAATGREKVAVALMAMSGVRPMVLGNYLGEDGLRLGDIPDVKVTKGGVTVEKTPIRIVIRRDLSKGGHSYCTFLGSEGVDYLKSYLEARVRKGERLGPDSPLIIPERAERQFIRTVNIGDLIRHALRGAELNGRPYVLRTTFATRMLTCESNGKVPHSFAQFWMGHSGDMTARYNLNRGLLPDSVLADMARAYHRCEQELGTASMKPEVDQSELKRALLAYAGLSEAEVSAEERKASGEIPWERIVEIARERRAASISIPPPAASSVPGEQKVVPGAAVEAWLSAGWQFVSVLGGDRAIVRSGAGPSSPAPVGQAG
jgi:integrase